LQVKLKNLLKVIEAEDLIRCDRAFQAFFEKYVQLKEKIQPPYMRIILTQPPLPRFENHLMADQTNVKFFTPLNYRKPRIRTILKLSAGRCVGVSSDGTKILFEGENHSINVLDTISNKLLLPISALQLMNVRLSLDGTKLITFNKQNAVKILDTASGQSITKLTITEKLLTACFSHDGARLAVVNKSCTAQVWDVLTCECLFETAVSEFTVATSKIIFSPDGKQLAIKSAANTLTVWNIFSGQCSLRFLASTTEITQIVFSPDSNTLVIGKFDKTIQVLSITCEKTLITLTGYMPQSSRIIFSPDGEKIAYATGFSEIEVWDHGTHKRLARLTGLQGSTTVVFAPLGGHRHLVTYGSCEAIIWDVVKGKYLKKWSSLPHQIRHVAFSSDGKTLIMGLSDARILIYDIYGTISEFEMFETRPPKIQTVYESITNNML
jgi:WD40 repeat protein